MGELIKSVIHAADKLRATQDTYHETALGLQQMIAVNQQQIENFGIELDSIRQILREGFRLPNPEREV
jgi:uncharacterized coiled-coil DUF342 family protein